MVSELLLERIVLRELRNLQHVELEPAPRLNVIAGDNGQGKTSLLEGIYLLATSRSFRTTRLAELVRHGQSCCSARGRFCERPGIGAHAPLASEEQPLTRAQTEQSAAAASSENLSPPPAAPVPPAPSNGVTLSREQSCALEGSQRTLRLDAQPPPSQSYYATRSPVVVFDPRQMTRRPDHRPPGGRSWIESRCFFAPTPRVTARATSARDERGKPSC